MTQQVMGGMIVNLMMVGQVLPLLREKTENTPSTPPIPQRQEHLLQLVQRLQLVRQHLQR